MKIGFSTLTCPNWDLRRVISEAAAMGFDGVEIRGLQGQLDLAVAPELARDPEGVQALFREHKVELACIATSAVLSSRSTRARSEAKATIASHFELARRLGCPAVRIMAGETESGESRQAALARVAEGLASLVPAAVRNDVSLLVENGGDFPSSADMWRLIDAVNHPAVRCCWNQCHGLTLGERPTVSIPRLGLKLGMVRVCDATFDSSGALLDYRPLGAGQAEIGRAVELLRGVLYRRYLMVEWPKLWVPSLPAPEQWLPAAAQFLKLRLAEKQPILSAYKGDKNAPKLAALPTE